MKARRGFLPASITCHLHGRWFLNMQCGWSNSRAFPFG